MSKQHGNLPEPARPSGGGRNRRPAPFKLWYRVTYTAQPSGETHGYEHKAGA